MNKVFVTGANGLLGTNLVLMLLNHRYNVVALVRKKNNFFNPNLNNLQLIEGNLSETKKLSQEIATCKFVVHIAADTSQNLLRLKEYYRANVQGTKNIIDACTKKNVEKLVYIGTANTFGYGSLLDLGNESKLMKYPFTKSLYAQSKKQAQDIIDKASSELNITTISPTFMLGSYDTKPSSGRIILTVLNKKIMFYPLGGKNFIHVNDVAKSIIKAFDVKQSGHKFILSNENMSYKAFFEKVILLNNQKTRLLPTPNILLNFIGLFGDFLRLLKLKTDISSVNTKILTIKNYYSNNKAKNDLEIKFTSIDMAIIDALEFFNKKKVE